MFILKIAQYEKKKIKKGKRIFLKNGTYFVKYLIFSDQFSEKW